MSVVAVLDQRDVKILYIIRKIMKRKFLLENTPPVSAIAR
eukprot:COSAG05_NODE_17270_length_328_cov_1.109170_1_plen_39_part_01